MKLSIFVLLLLANTLLTCPPAKASSIDVLHYRANIEPDIPNKKIRGEVSIEFKALQNTQEISFDCDGLKISELNLLGIPSSYRIKGRKVYISLKESLRTHETYELKITYEGNPRWGVVFHPEASSISTVFSTSQWMVCKEAIEDKATLDLTIIAPKELTVVASGQWHKQTEIEGGKIASQWHLEQPVSAYIFGFAIGPFNTTTQKHKHTRFDYLSAKHQSEELLQIFAETGNMLDFFEKKSGIPYPDSTYNQILFKGGISQEMANFCILRENYGEQVLKDPTAVNLAAHELAHQWWGNQVTCKDWTHFWLNEGMAVYMSTAFREHRWGKEVYEADMKVYYDAFQKVVQNGKDKGLVFPNWNNPSSEDRVLVYYKGAYVFHLLRQKLGDQTFWQALKRYTQAYYGKSVVTKDLQRIFEEVSHLDLQSFFDEWGYKK